jgi:hypothetical protein
MPDLSVNIRAAMFMDISSWKSSLAAYGMCTCAILVLFLQGLHSNVCLVRFLHYPLAYRKKRKVEGGTYAIGVMRPQFSQMCTRNASETSKRRSLRKEAAP